MKLLYKKIINRLKKITGRFVSHNIRYRPQSIFRLHADDAQAQREARLYPVYPALRTTLDIPEALYEACSAYWKPQREVTTDYEVVEAPNGRIYTDNDSTVAIISKYNRLIENVSLSMKEGKVTENGYNNIFEQRYFSTPTRFEGTVFSLLTGGAGLNNISHWFVDVLPRLHLLKESGLYDKVDWFLVPSLRYGFQLETLRLLGIPDAKLIAGDEHPHIMADCIIASTAPRGNHTLVPQWLCQYIQGAFVPLATQETEADQQDVKLYISRSDSKLRQVENEAELVEALKPYGYRSVVLSQLSVLERIKLFSRASSVVSATGAGLVSMMFCKPGTQVIELFHEGFVVEPFYDIATKMGMDYSYIICKSNSLVKDAGQGQHENLKVELPELVELIRAGKKNKRQAQPNQQTNLKYS
ncbi:glycosyltransferase family 61 protein [Pontibacter sp. FD36]|uniref:glycosyltransferase family 61 protein n=1 Tax=Pontibacter sp. FD36 TaxID=2789860 RepID=UPI0018A8E163|nr:glycosyltransferase family 61 protein [Pontibacter sp. FD36]MBF8963732.1 glycosyltransferase family 61 protein [Pontibacter sp. FD36]